MEPACLVCRSSKYLTQGCGGLSLSHRWSLIRPHPVHRGKGSAVASLSHHWSLIRPHPVRRGKGRKCIVSPFDGAEAARPDLRYTPFSLTKLQRGRAFTTSLLSQYGQIPAAGALLVTSQRPPGIPSGLTLLPIFPRCLLWIFFSCLLKSYLSRRTFHLAISSSNHF